MNNILDRTDLKNLSNVLKKNRNGKVQFLREQGRETEARIVETANVNALLSMHYREKTDMTCFMSESDWKQRGYSVVPGKESEGFSFWGKKTEQSGYPIETRFATEQVSKF